MPVYQAKKPVVVTWYYDRMLLMQGQLVALNDPKLVKVLESNPNIEEVIDDELIRLAPPLHMIRQPQDPYHMRKEDVIYELRSYGIKVDPYQMSHTLSMQLQTARAMLKRNFITVLNNRGQPVFIDSAKLPVSKVFSPIDETLPEPEDVNEEDYEPVEDVVNSPSVEEITDSVNEKVSADVDVKIQRGDIAASIDPNYTEAEMSRGTDYSEWLRQQAELAEKEYRAPVEQSISDRDKTLSQPQEIIVDEVYEEIKENYKIKDIEFVIDSLKDNPRHFILEEPSAEDQENWYKIKYSAINIDVAENVLRYNGIKVDYDDTDKKTHRWEILDALKAFIEGSEENRKWMYTVNALQARHNELCKHEPNYRTMTHKGLKRKATELGKYGLTISYSNATNIRNFTRKVYQIAKLGLQCPDTEEEINALLTEHKRSAVVK